MSRRDLLKTGSLAALGTAPFSESMAGVEAAGGADLKGKIHHSACRWCYSTIPLEELAKAGKDMGLVSEVLITIGRKVTVST